MGVSLKGQLRSGRRRVQREAEAFVRRRQQLRAHPLSPGSPVPSPAWRAELVSEGSGQHPSESVPGEGARDGVPVRGAEDPTEEASHDPPEDGT